jgi:hypothetical protein
MYVDIRYANVVWVASMLLTVIIIAVVHQKHCDDKYKGDEIDG